MSETKLPLRDALIQAIQKTGEVCDCGNCPEDVADAVLAVLERNKQPEDAMPGFTAGGYYDAPTNAICVKPCGKCCYPQDCAEAARCLKQPQQADGSAVTRYTLEAVYSAEEHDHVVEWTPCRDGEALRADEVLPLLAGKHPKQASEDMQK